MKFLIIFRSLATCIFLLIGITLTLVAERPNIVLIVSNVSDIGEDFTEGSNEHHLPPSGVRSGGSSMIERAFIQYESNPLDSHRI